MHRHLVLIDSIDDNFVDTFKGFVEVRVQYQPPFAEFIVSDSGVGIPGAMTGFLRRSLWHHQHSSL